MPAYIKAESLVFVCEEIGICFLFAPEVIVIESTVSLPDAGLAGIESVCVLSIDIEGGFSVVKIFCDLFTFPTCVAIAGCSSAIIGS